MIEHPNQSRDFSIPLDIPPTQFSTPESKSTPGEKTTGAETNFSRGAERNFSSGTETYLGPDTNTSAEALRMAGMRTAGDVLDVGKGGSTLDFSPTYLNGEVKVLAPASFDGNLPGIGISHGTDLFLPDVQLALLDKTRDWTETLQPGAKPDGAKPEVAPLPANARIAEAAQKNAGTQPWADSKYAPQVQNGRLAGAAAVSMVLQDLGYSYADSANVGTLSSQLAKQGWQKVPLDQAKPGDVIYGGRVGTDWRAGGGNAHVGIVGQDGKIWHNNSATGKWQQDSVSDSFPDGKYGNQVWVMRAPQTDVPDRPVPDRPVRPDRPTPPSPGRDVRPRPDDSVPRPDDIRPRPGDDPNIRPEDEQPGDQNIKGNARILKNAKNDIDRRLWEKSDFRNMVNGGRLGCAASVSEVLKESGYKYANSAGVGGMVDILKQHGWTKVPLNEARPGDVVYAGKPGTRWWEGGGNAHIGVVGENGKVFHNSSGKRRWVQDDLTKVFNTNRFGDNRFAMRPPQNS